MYVIQYVNDRKSRPALAGNAVYQRIERGSKFTISAVYKREHFSVCFYFIVKILYVLPTLQIAVKHRDSPIYI